MEYTHINADEQNELVGERIRQLEADHYRNSITLKLVAQQDEALPADQVKQLEELEKTQETLESGIRALRGELAANLGANGSNGGPNRAARRAKKVPADAE